MTPRIITDATVEPLSYDDIVEHSRLRYNQQRSLVESYIRAARASSEDYINGTISPKTLEIAVASFENFHVDLPLGPVQSIVSIIYIDADGNEQPLDPTSYVLDGYRATRTVRLAYGASWPTARAQFDAVRIRYTAGFPFNDSPPSPVPEPILQAIRLQVDHMNENRTAVDLDTLAVLPLGVKYYLDPYRQNLGV